ncbi:MAG: LCP family protein [Actinomycetes bacterium]
MADEQGRTPAPRRHAALPRRVPLVVLVVLSGLVVAATGATAVAYLRLDRNIASQNVTSALGTDRPRVVAGPAPGRGDRAENILVIGSDTRSAPGDGQYGSGIQGARSDTVILLHLSADRRRAELVSIPRDSWVAIPSCNLGASRFSSPRVERFNAAYAIGGTACTIKTVEQLTQIRIDHFVVIDFHGFATMVDSLGGVEVCLNQPITNKEAQIDLPAGRQVLDGSQALGYVRVRYIGDGSDLSRIVRQQAFLASLVTKVTSTGLLLNPVRLYQFLDAATRSVTTDPAFASLTSLASLATSVRNVPRSNVTFLTVPNHPYPANPNVVEWSQPSAGAIFDALRHDAPIPGRPSTTTTSPPSSSPVPTLTVPPAQVRVQVLDASGVPGAASRAAAALRAVGFTVVGVGTATGPVLATTQIHRPAAYDRSGATLAAALPGVRVQVDPSLGRTLQVLVGTSYPTAVPVAIAPGGADAPTPTPTLSARSAVSDICSVPS